MPKYIETKQVLNKKKKRDSWFLDDYTFNPYRSCSFNCLYCYIRGSKYGLNLENSLAIKANAIELLDKQLFNRAKKRQYGFIVLSSATDPYIHIEKEQEITRESLRVILKHKFPVHIITKSNLVTRDFDILHQINREAILPDDLMYMQKGVMISFSFSTVEDSIARVFEPGAPLPSTRLTAVQKTLNEKFLCGVSLMPLLPFISDTGPQLHKTFSLFKEIGVHYLMPSTITLFGNAKADSKTLVFQAIQKHYPDLLEKYKSYFATGSQMPTFYQKAFHQKMKEMLTEYGLHGSILESVKANM